MSPRTSLVLADCAARRARCNVYLTRRRRWVGNDDVHTCRSTETCIVAAPGSVAPRAACDVVADRHADRPAGTLFVALYQPVPALTTSFSICASALRSDTFNPIWYCWSLNSDACCLNKLIAAPPITRKIAHCDHQFDQRESRSSLTCAAGSCEGFRTFRRGSWMHQAGLI